MNPNDETQLSPAAIERHIKNLQDQNPRQRSQSAYELGELRAFAAVPALIQALQEDVNTYVRSAVAESLGRIGAPEAIFPLMDALRDNSSFVRRAAAISLGQMQAKQAQMALLQALDDQNFYVRRAAINAIGKLGVNDLGPLLLPYLENQDPRIQRTTITALRRLGTAEAIDTLAGMLAVYQTSPNPHDLPLVKSLVIALGDLRAVGAVPVLIQVVRGYVGVRSLAAAALGQIGDPQAGPALLEVLEDKSISLRLAALKSLGKLHYQEAAPTLHRFLNDPDPRLRRVATRALGELGLSEATEALLTIAEQDASPLVRPAAVEALAKIGDPSVLPRLLPLVDDTNAYLRAALAYTLHTLGNGSPEAQKALKQLRKDPVEHVALAAQRAMEMECAPAPRAPALRAPAPRKSAPPSAAKKKKAGSWLQRLLHRD